MSYTHQKPTLIDLHIDTSLDKNVRKFTNYNFVIKSYIPNNSFKKSEFKDYKHFIENISEQGTDGWMSCRLGRITSTHYGGASGMNIYTNKLKIAYNIFGVKEDIDKRGIENIELGLYLERHIINSYTKHTGNTVKEVGFCISKENPIFGFSPDGFVGEDGIIECKGVKKLYQGLQNKINGTDYKLENTYEGIPLYQYCQIQGILHLSKRKFAEYCVGDFNMKKVYYERLDYNKEFCDDMFRKIDDFIDNEYSYVKKISDGILKEYL